MRESRESSYSRHRFDKEQLETLKKFIEREKTKAGGDLRPVFYKGVDKNGNPFTYINGSFKVNKKINAIKKGVFVFFQKIFPEQFLFLHNLFFLFRQGQIFYGLIV